MNTGDVALEASLSGSDYAVIALLSGGGTISLQGFPQWSKHTVTFEQLAAASTENNIELFSLPPGGVLHTLRTKHSESFSGGNIIAYQLQVGLALNLNKYTNESFFDVFQPVGNTVFAVFDGPFSENATAATSIRVGATSTGDNLDAATAGSVDIHVLTSVIAP